MDPDPDPGGPKTYGSDGSGSATLQIPQIYIVSVVGSCLNCVRGPVDPDPYSRRLISEEKVNFFFFFENWMFFSGELEASPGPWKSITET